jgi:hypothetical protein
LGQPVAIKSKVTWLTPGEARASSTAGFPETVPPEDGTTIETLGGGLFTVIEMLGLVVLELPSMATLWRLYVPLGTVVEFQDVIHP